MFDVSGHLGLLTASDNVLAIQGLNASAADADFFLEAELSASLGTVGGLNPGAIAAIQWIAAAVLPDMG